MNAPELKIYRPIRSNWLTQRFGENRTCIDHNGKVTTKTGSVCPIYSEDFYQSMGMNGHNGEDWAAWHGEPLYHSGDYEGIAQTEVDSAGGIGIDVISKVPFGTNGEFVKLRYWHLKKVAIHDGQEIVPGQLIGWCDSTGASSGDHLHWALKPCDAQGNTLEPDNGFTGCVDFRPWFENTFILEWLGTKEAGLSAIELAKKVIFNAVQYLKNRQPEPPRIPSFKPEEMLTPPAPVEPQPATETLEQMALRIAKEEGLDAELRTQLFKTIAGESSWKTNAINPPLSKPPYSNGSRDYGLCQFNTSDHGAGWYAKLISPHDALHNPEKAVRLMCKQFKAGRARDWIAWRKIYEPS